MAESFFFYDLETSGFNPREARVMQFAGQRTDLQLQPIGEPINVLIQLTDDILPDPGAILVTGITPQTTRADGITEAEFLRLFTDQVATPGTVFVGFNTIRFDDEFMRYMHYRNFYDPYEWQWQDKRSKWDVLDVVRLTRALRPDGIKWPVDTNGKPTNRLELLTSLNKLDHANAHDALSDVHATIAVARLIYNKQSKLFNYLLSMRDKKAVQQLVESDQPFVYASGQYSSEFEKTTVAIKLASHPKKQGYLVYDLRYDPAQFANKTPAELSTLMRWTKDPDAVRLPVKTLQANRCPAIAPLSVLDKDSQKRLQLHPEIIENHRQKLAGLKTFADNVLKAIELTSKEQQTQLLASPQDVDSQLYDGFFNNRDKTVMSAIRASDPSDVSELAKDLQDQRLKTLLPLYKARNYPKKLTDEERELWEQYRTHRLMDGDKSSRAYKFFASLQEMSERPGLTDQQKFLIEELNLYAESILPEPNL
jgi:exodeoxyribonuclease-1